MSHAINVESAKRKSSALPDSSWEPAAKIPKISPDVVVQTISSYFLIQPIQLCQGRGERDGLPRNITIYILNNFLRVPKESIGDYFGLHPSGVTRVLHEMMKKIQANNATVVDCLKNWKKENLSFGPPPNNQEQLFQAGISPDVVIQKVTSRFGITRAQLQQGREGVDVLSKNISIYILSNYLHLSEANIGKYFGLQSSAVESSIQQIKHKIQTNHFGVTDCLKYWEDVQSSFLKKAAESQPKGGQIFTLAPISETANGQTQAPMPSLDPQELREAALNLQMALEQPPWPKAPTPPPLSPRELLGAVRHPDRSIQMALEQPPLPKAPTPSLKPRELRGAVSNPNRSIQTAAGKRPLPKAPTPSLSPRELREAVSNPNRSIQTAAGKRPLPKAPPPSLSPRELREAVSNPNRSIQTAAGKRPLPKAPPPSLSPRELREAARNLQTALNQPPLQPIPSCLESKQAVEKQPENKEQGPLAPNYTDDAIRDREEFYFSFQEADQAGIEDQEEEPYFLIPSPLSESAVSMCQNNSKSPEFGANLDSESATPPTDSSDWEDILSLDHLD